MEFLISLEKIVYTCCTTNRTHSKLTFESVTRYLKKLGLRYELFFSDQFSNSGCGFPVHKRIPHFSFTTRKGKVMSDQIRYRISNFLKWKEYHRSSDHPKDLIPMKPFQVVFPGYKKISLFWRTRFWKMEKIVQYQTSPANRRKNNLLKS